MCEVLSQISLVFADPGSGSREIIGENTRDVVEAERDFSRNYGPYYRAASVFLRVNSPAIRNVVVAVTERLNCEGFLSFIKDNNTYTVGNLVIIHIEYDYALDVLLYLMADESDKNDEIRKKKLSLEQQEKLSKILRDIETKSEGMPLAKKMDLLLAAVMLFTQQEYP